MMLKNIMQRKPVGILLGAHFGIERDILLHFSLAGYEICHAPTIDDAKMYFNASNYDFILFFESFVGGPTFGFIRSLSQERLKNAIALIDNGMLGKYDQREGAKISHFFYVRTNPAILQFFVDQIFGVSRLRVEACSN